MGWRFDDIFKRLPEVKAAAIVSIDGLPIASLFPKDIDEKRIAAMTATLFSLCDKTIIEMNKGMFDQFYIKGTNGYLLAMSAGPEMILIVSTTKDVRLGLILLDCRRVCEKIARIGRDFDDNDEERYPYPYIFKPPEPPDDIKLATQLQVNKFNKEELRSESVCPYCGKTLTRDELFSHDCRKKPK
jgi:predicted regulator of Ras-like GTPase activity (Roadblock/LC7/MglB family)